MAKPNEAPLQWTCYRDETGRRVEAMLFEGRIIEPPMEKSPSLASESDFSHWLASSVGNVSSAIEQLETHCRNEISLANPQEEKMILSEIPWSAPLSDQEVWGAGVTYLRSREARQEEAQDGGDVYARVYRAERPEVFYKGNVRNVVGQGEAVGIRSDSAWNVPEPELAVLFNPALETVGFTIGLDMSSRSIEGENPLYLPQAKVYNASCALGPGLVIQNAAEWPQMSISMTIERNEAEVFHGETDTAQLARSLGELAEYLGRCNDFPKGVYLLTGTGIVPPAEFTLREGDVVRTEISEIGVLVNTVIRV